MAQNGPKWATGGNNLSGGEVLGSTNNFPLNFIVNNQQELAILTNGNLQVASLNNGNTGLVTYSSNGTLTPLNFTGNGGQVLSGNGTWVAGNSFSQWITNGSNIYYNGGYVGIGLPNPTAPLTVSGNIVSTGNIYGNTLAAANSVQVGTVKITSTGNVDTLRSTSSLQVNATTINAGTINTGNLIAAGTNILLTGINHQDSVSDFLQIDQMGRVSSVHLNSLQQYLYTFAGYTPDPCEGSFSNGSVFWQNIGELALNNGQYHPYLITSSACTYVGIGTSTPQTNLEVAGNALITGYMTLGNPSINVPVGYKLYVANGILTEKVKIATLNGPDWSDYVFEKGYKLRPLTEVESYIYTNKHLPEVPSAKDIKKDGIDVAKIDEIMVKKIEELTLYTIDQNKKIINLDNQIQELNARLKELEKRGKN